MAMRLYLPLPELLSENQSKQYHELVHKKQLGLVFLYVPEALGQQLQVLMLAFFLSV